MDVTIFDDERLDKVNENISIIQKKNGLTFGSDTYLLSAFIKEQRYGHAADLGSGTGIAALLCAARKKFSHIYAVEIQDSFYDLIKRNSEINGFGDTITAINKDIRYIKSEDVGGELDAVFSNPPYMKINSGKRNVADEKYIARHEVFGGIHDFCAAASRLLKFGGKFYCVYRPDRLSELMSAMCDSRLEPKRMTFVYPDTDSIPSAVLIEAKKGAAPALCVTKPLIIYKSLNTDGTAREMTDIAKKIYDTCSFEDFR